MKPSYRGRPQGTRGSTVVEFALVQVLFLTLLLGITDFGRLLFTWNAATEATRLGARYAVVCDDTSAKAKVLARMRALLPQIRDISVVWNPSGCTAATCQGVTVNITSLDYQWISPVAGALRLGALQAPAFSTYLPREAMGQDPASAALCS
ncbi:MAG TPA: TadE family protein [Janthinobacterium sp.]|jgi:hypothetical protein|nr:TadE family protein [Janthinobacterium sp.]